MEKSDQSKSQDAIINFKDDDKVNERIQDDVVTAQEENNFVSERQIADPFDHVILNERSESSNENSSDNSHFQFGFAEPTEESGSEDSTRSNEQGVASLGDEYRTRFEEMEGGGRWNSNGKILVCSVRYERSDKYTSAVRDFSSDPNQFSPERPCRFKSEGEMFFFHATNQDSAEKIMSEFPKLRKKIGDLVGNGAFYLTLDPLDCFKWFHKKNSVFKGKYALLIFKFHPRSLDPNGEELTVKEWKQRFPRLNEERCKLSWLYVPQNSDPANADKRGKKPKPNQRPDGEIAMQLIIRSEKMCVKLSEYLVACYFYEKTSSSTRRS